MSQNIDLSIFSSKGLFEAGTDLFQQLGIKLNSNTSNPLDTSKLLKEYYKSDNIISKIQETYFLGLINDEVLENSDKLFDNSISFKEVEKKINSDYNGLMVFAVNVKINKLPTRTDLSLITRTFNRISKNLPVIVIIKYKDETGYFISFSACERTKYKQSWREGEKIGKVSILKDINLKSPHTGHLKILLDLKLTSSPKMITSFSGLYDYWKQVFDISILNRKFYKEIFNWYSYAIKVVKYPNPDNLTDEQNNSVNIIRLLTRLIFCWFIKEKNLIKNELFDFDIMKNILTNFGKDLSNSIYYKAILQNLFFATLNTSMNKDEPGSRRFITDKLNSNGVSPDYNNFTVFRHRELFDDPKNALFLFAEIPFLNGGLFECLDLVENVNGKNKEIRYDGFSTKKSKQPYVPDYLFFGTIPEVDLSSDYGDAKYNKEIVIGLIDILKSYKFTITENTPLEEEIALDPELLGKVFENLLATYNPETKTSARKQTGSYYTPRQIVDFMVDESIILYLINTVNEKSLIEDFDTNLRKILAYESDENPFNENESEILINAISNCKILDPACGSGAYPMGILHKLVLMLGKLDKYNIKWKKAQLEIVEQDRLKALEFKDQVIKERALNSCDERKKYITDSFNSKNHELDYFRKLYLIENCIYGVDKQNIAVQIAKLRFFISLIVDQQKDENKINYGILAMPNLDTKFVAANTVVELKRHTGFSDDNVLKKEIELKQIREKIFYAKKYTEKKKLKEEEKIKRIELENALKKSGWGEKTAQQIAEWNPFDASGSAKFFDPFVMFGFDSGFDIIIGNPPYIKEYTDRKAFDGLRDSEYYKGKMDIWYMFACKGIDMIKDNTGILTYIAQNNWVTSYGASKLRDKIIKDSCIEKLIDFRSYMIFESSDIQTMIMIFKRDKTIDNYYFDYRRLSGIDLNFEDVLNLLYKHQKANNEILNPQISRKNFIGKSILFSRTEVEKILNKFVLKSNIKLYDYEMTNGIHHHHDFVSKETKNILGKNFNIGDGIFVLSHSEKDSISFTKNELKLIKPSYTTKELKKYYGNPINNEWVIYTESNFKDPNAIKPYPNIKKHLDKFKNVITSDNWPYGLHRSREEDFFLGEKIISVRKCSQPTFTYTDFDCYVSATFYVIKTDRINLKYLTGLLNSKLIEFWLRHKGKMQGNNYQVDKEPLLEIPIYKPENQKPIVDLMDKIIENKKNNKETDDLESKIDIIVYKLYGLMYSEVKIIDSNFGLTEKEYEKFNF